MYSPLSCKTNHVIDCMAKLINTNDGHYWGRKKKQAWSKNRLKSWVRLKQCVNLSLSASVPPCPPTPPPNPSLQPAFFNLFISPQSSLPQTSGQFKRRGEYKWLLWGWGGSNDSLNSTVRVCISMKTINTPGKGVHSRFRRQWWHCNEGFGFHCHSCLLHGGFQNHWRLLQA